MANVRDGIGLKRSATNKSWHGITTIQGRADLQTNHRISSPTVSRIMAAILAGDQEEYSLTEGGMGRCSSPSEE